MLVIWTQNWSILAKFAKKNPAKSAAFYRLFLGEVEVFPRNFPWNGLIFLIICSWKCFKFWLFSAKIPPNRPIFPRICPWKSREILLFFSRNIRSPVSTSPVSSERFCNMAISHILSQVVSFILTLSLLLLVKEKIHKNIQIALCNM